MPVAGKARPGKTRLDLLLVERGLVQSRERARAMILAGRVLVGEQKIDKPGTSVAQDSAIRLLGEDQPYVSRGGLKLAAALEHWKIDVEGRACIDIGTSTGGFTDCLLQHGAAQVTAIDTGFGQIAMKLRNDPRVQLMERTNARLLEPGSLTAPTPGQKHAAHETPSPHAANRTPPTPPTPPTPLTPLSFLVMDVSFISATLVLGPVLAAAPALNEAVILVKPQFEAGREHVGKGGIVRDPAAHQLAIDRVAECVRSLGWQVVETIPSPITGAEGNREFLLYAKAVNSPPDPLHSNQ
ncbi:MAG: TlyA family RNA methyltransferase [Terracidiphilus sp.]|nr:TlyA family RNA methyltransferase [Terracidiphilus sp.]MDR3798726.1 TlyA family RNA methyltransferase [Terracidiphilus sp.]